MPNPTKDWDTFCARGGGVFDGDSLVTADDDDSNARNNRSRKRACIFMLSQINLGLIMAAYADVYIPP